MRHVLVSATILFAPSFLMASQPGNERPNQVTEPTVMNRVVFVDHDLNSSKGKKRHINVSVDRSGFWRNNAGFLEAWAVFRNHTDYDRVLDVRTQFFDETAGMTENATRWQRVYVPANSLQRYSALSIDPETEYFRIEVRSAE